MKVTGAKIWNSKNTSLCLVFANRVTYLTSGAYEPPKDHETFTACWVPSQSKPIANYLPYKESNISLCEAMYGLHMTTKQQWWRITWSHCVQLALVQSHKGHILALEVLAGVLL